MVSFIYIPKYSVVALESELFLVYQVWRLKPRLSQKAIVVKQSRKAQQSFFDETNNYRGGAVCSLCVVGLISKKGGEEM